MVFSRLGQLAQHRLYRSVYALLANNLLVAVSGYLFWIISARRFPEEVVGVASAALSSMAVLTSISDLGLGTGLIRFLPEQPSPGDADELVRSALTARIWTTAIATGIFLFSLPWVAPGLLILHRQPELGVMFLLLTVVNSVFLLQTAVLVAAHQARHVLLGGVIFNVTKLAGLFLGSPAHGISTILLSITAALCVSVLYSRFVAVTYGGSRVLPQLRLPVRRLRDFFGYSLVNQIANLLIETPALLLPILVLNSLGARATALFYTAWMLAGLLRTASISVSQSALAEGSTAPSSLYSNLWRSLYLNLLLIVVAGAVLALLGPWVLMLFGATYAAQGRLLLGWFIAAAIPFSFNNLLMTAQRVEKQRSRLLLSAAVVATTSIAGALWGLNAAGLEGLAIGWMGAQVTAMVVTGTLFLRGRGQYARTRAA